MEQPSKQPDVYFLEIRITDDFIVDSLAKSVSLFKNMEQATQMALDESHIHPSKMLPVLRLM